MAKTHTIWIVKWKCKLCPSISRHWIPRWRAKRSYRQHMHRYHPNDSIGDVPIFTYQRISGEGYGRRERDK